MSERRFDYELFESLGHPVEAFSAGDQIFSEGDSGDRMYILREGEVEILRDGNPIHTVGTDGIFGEMALIDGSARSADARAKTDCKAVAIDERGFIFLVTEIPDFAMNVLRSLSKRLRTANDLV